MRQQAEKCLALRLHHRINGPEMPPQTKQFSLNRVASCCGAVGEKKQMPISSMKKTSRKQDGLMAGLAGILCLACAPVILAVDYVSMTNFSTDPTAAGWQEAGAGATWNASGHLDVGSAGWYSPIFTPTAGQYYGVQYDAQLTTVDAKAQFGTFFGNPSATYNIETPPNTTPDGGGYLYRTTSSGAKVINGQLLDDNYTSIQPAGNGWSTITTYTRMPTIASESFIYFGPDSSGARVDNVHVFSASHADVRAFADGLYNNTANFPVKLNYTPPVNRFGTLPNTYSKLSSGQTLNVVLLGDSIMGDTTNSYFDTLIERNFPGSTVTVATAQGHGTGMNAWLNPDTNSWQQSPLKLQQAVYNQPAGSLVIIGGISNGGAADQTATQTIVQALKLQGKEVLLTTGDFGSYGNDPINPAAFVANVNGSTAGSDPTLAYRNWMYNLAQSEGVGFFDTYGAWGTYMIQLENALEPLTSLTADDIYYRDHWTHANTLGKDMVGQIYASYFTAVPEPSSLGILLLSAIPLCRRTRRTRRA
jgi:hypothetical protein